MKKRWKFQDVRDLIEENRLTQIEVAAEMGYRGDVFSRTLRGGQPPKGGASDEDFREAVKAAVRTLSEGGA